MPCIGLQGAVVQFAANREYRGEPLPLILTELGSFTSFTQHTGPRVDFTKSYRTSLILSCPNLGLAMRLLSPRTSLKLGLVLTLCEIVSWGFMSRSKDKAIMVKDTSVMTGTQTIALLIRNTRA